MDNANSDCEAFEWQVGVWDRISGIYSREIDDRFASVVESIIARAALSKGERILDLGTGTGAVAERSAGEVGRAGRVLGVDISPDMLAIAERRLTERGISNVSLAEGRGEDIPADSAGFDAVLSSLTLMYLIDRDAGAREIARVLRPGGRLVAAIWGAADACDIVRFQQTAGRFAGPPPAAGVGPGALADPSPFLEQLANAGIEAHVETQVHTFDFPDFQSAWTALAGVTTAHLSTDRQRAAQDAVRRNLYPEGDGPRRFRNLTQLLIGERTA
jgi:SAM-dependent methyltransferase